MSKIIRSIKKFNTVCKNNGIRSGIRFTFHLLYMVYSKQGIKGIIAKFNQTSQCVDVLDTYSYVINRDTIELNEKEKELALGQATILINWIIPDFGVGASGGHTTLFRFIDCFEKNGFHNKVYLWGKDVQQSEEGYLKQFVKDNYGIYSEQIEIDSNINNISFAHITIATSWQTAYFVRRFNNTLKKYYFVQDFEPAFYPMGSDYLLAENTYRFGLKGIFAGDWLKKKLEKDYSMTGKSFSFAFDSTIYNRHKTQNVHKSLLLYARPSTERRCFELALLALKEVANRTPNVQIGFYGEDCSRFKIPFDYVNYGFISHEKLAELYSETTVCLIMSPTNLSLVPIEAAAAGAIVALTEGENNQWMFDSSNAVILSNNPMEMADSLCNILSDEASQGKYDNSWVSNHDSWKEECLRIADYLKNDIKEIL